MCSLEIMKVQFQQCERREGAERQLSQPHSYSHPECRPLLKFVKAAEPPDHVTLTTQAPVMA